MIDNNDIQCVTTREYWKQFEPSQINDAMRYYICEGHRRLGDKSLLEAELEYAEDNIKVDRCETLVLLVGFSLEPLLQSVCVYKPQKIVLLLNQEGYAGEECHQFADHVVEAIGHLASKGLIDDLPVFPGKFPGRPGYPTPDKPDKIFKTLVDVLHDETNVVIDITGGKKSMVSGAYMYAAYAGTRISYVDFDEYDPDKRRPYGYSCRIGALNNPYQTFALREWERVRELYSRYQFQEAQKVLQSLSPAIKQAMPDTAQPISKLADFLTYYGHWDRGDFRQAKQAAASLDAFDQPSVVTALGDQWFEIAGSDFVNKPTHFYGNLPAVHAYVCDELARIRRLIDYNEDYRSAFLRAGGVNEIVMLARVVQLVTDQIEQSLLLDALEEKTPRASDIFKALLESTGKDISIGTDRKYSISFTKAPTLTVSHPAPMKSWWRATNLFNAGDGWDAFLTLRNDLIHKYFSVPREWARDALLFVQANFEDFLGHSLEGLNLRTTVLTWPELCNLCGLSRFLPPSLRKEA